MSAPATKPDFLPEMRMSAGGGSRSKRSSSGSNSANIDPESALAELPGRSMGIQAMPSASTSSRQEPGVGTFMMLSSRTGNPSGCGDLAQRRARAHLEVAHERAVVREAHVRDAEVRDLDALTHQHEVELDARRARREGGQPRGIGAAQPRRPHEQINLVRAPEGVEVPGDDHRFLGLQDQVMERAQLILPM